MMTLSNGNIFRVTEINGDLRRHRAHYDVTAMLNTQDSSAFMTMVSLLCQTHITIASKYLIQMAWLNMNLVLLVRKRGN